MQWSFSLNNVGVHLSLQSWRWCLRCCSVVVSSKGMNKVEQNYTHTHTHTHTHKPHQVSQVQMQYSFSKFFSMQVQFSCSLIKGREKKRKKKSLETILRMVSTAVACLPAAVSLLLLEALFMQISGVSLVLTWPCRFCFLRVLLCVSLCYKLSPFQAHWGRWHYTRILRPACLFIVHVGNGSSLLSCGVFLPLPLSQTFPFLVAGHVPPTPTGASPAHRACLFTVPGRIPFPQSLALSAPHPLSHVFIVLIAY
jgi:hypothetical protein